MEDEEEQTPCQRKCESPWQMGQAWGMHENWNHRPFQTQQKQEACRDEQGQSRKREKRNRLFCSLFTSNVSPEALAPSCCQILNSALALGRWARLILKTSSGATQWGWPLGSSMENRIKEKVSTPGWMQYSGEGSPPFVTGTHISQICENTARRAVC